jgi:mannose-1-phosphate guanylyltransferase
MIQRANENRVDKSAQREHEWAVILAGGDGTRLKCLTRRIAGDERPKQFCSVMGGATLLEQTRQRVAMEVAGDRTLYVFNRLHAAYYESLLPGSAANFVIQPSNRGTAPAILYSLLRIASIDRTAVVALFPSDHFISDNAGFMAHIRTALETAARRPELVILLGIEPETPEVEYGWIEPTVATVGHPDIFGVRRFWEKPHKLLAEALQMRGCLWNSFVMVASVDALLEIIEAATPDLYRSFSCFVPLFGTYAESKAINRLYDRLPEINFSQQILARCPERLAVLKVNDVVWSDLGEPKRVLASLEIAGVRPPWVNAPAPEFLGSSIL